MLLTSALAKKLQFANDDVLRWRDPNGKIAQLDVKAMFKGPMLKWIIGRDIKVRFESGFVVNQIEMTAFCPFGLLLNQIDRRTVEFLGWKSCKHLFCLIRFKDHNQIHIIGGTKL